MPEDRRSMQCWRLYTALSCCIMAPTATATASAVVVSVVIRTSCSVSIAVSIPANTKEERQDGLAISAFKCAIPGIQRCTRQRCSSRKQINAGDDLISVEPRLERARPVF